MKRVIRPSVEEYSSTFKFYFKDGNQKLFEAENMYDALSHVLFVEKRYTAEDIYKVEEVEDQ